MVVLSKPFPEGWAKLVVWLDCIERSRGVGWLLAVDVLSLPLAAAVCLEHQGLCDFEAGERRRQSYNLTYS